LILNLIRPYWWSSTVMAYYWLMYTVVLSLASGQEVTDWPVSPAERQLQGNCSSQVSFFPLTCEAANLLAWSNSKLLDLQPEPLNTPRLVQELLRIDLIRDRLMAASICQVTGNSPMTDYTVAWILRLASRDGCCAVHAGWSTRGLATSSMIITPIPWGGLENTTWLSPACLTVDMANTSATEVAKDLLASLARFVSAWWSHWRRGPK